MRLASSQLSAGWTDHSTETAVSAASAANSQIAVAP